MVKIVLDGKEVTVQGLETDQLVVVRPTEKLTDERFANFCKWVERVQKSVRHLGIVLIAAPRGIVTFDAVAPIKVPVREQACHHKDTDLHHRCSACGYQVDFS